jgi:hypothetical protein
VCTDSKLWSARHGATPCARQALGRSTRLFSQPCDDDSHLVSGLSAINCSISQSITRPGLERSVANRLLFKRPQRPRCGVVYRSSLSPHMGIPQLASKAACSDSSRGIYFAETRSISTIYGQVGQSSPRGYLCRVTPTIVELLHLPRDDVAEAVPNVSTELRIGWPSSFRRPLRGCFDRQTVSVSQLSTADPSVVRGLIHGGVFPGGPACRGPYPSMSPNRLRSLNRLHVLLCST